MNGAPKIQVRGLRKAFGRNVVLDGIDLDIGVGESVVVIGGSGSGKSVMVKCILGLLEPDAGSVKIDGEEVIGLPTRDRERVMQKFGMLSPAELSGGMQKRVALARAIAAEPEILFFDEPTTGLDPIMADVINRLIVDCVRGLGATAISITHDMVSARKIADNIAMLHDGHIIWHGPTAEIDRADNPYVDQFVHGRAEGPIQMQIRAA